MANTWDTALMDIALMEIQQSGAITVIHRRHVGLEGQDPHAEMWPQQASQTDVGRQPPEGPLTCS